MNVVLAMMDDGNVAECIELLFPYSWDMFLHEWEDQTNYSYANYDCDELLKMEDCRFMIILGLPNSKLPDMYVAPREWKELLTASALKEAITALSHIRDDGELHIGGRKEVGA